MDNYNGYLGGYGNLSMKSIVSQLGFHRKLRLKQEAGITSVDGFEGIDKINIPHKYNHIEIGGKYFVCFLMDRKTVYTKEGKFLFECSNFKYYKQGAEIFLQQPKNQSAIQKNNQGELEFEKCECSKEIKDGIQTDQLEMKFSTNNKNHG